MDGFCARIDESSLLEIEDLPSYGLNKGVGGQQHGGGAGSGMIYRLGKTDHKLDNSKMIDHIVALVEERAKELSEK